MAIRVGIFHRPETMQTHESIFSTTPRSSHYSLTQTVFLTASVNKPICLLLLLPSPSTRLTQSIYILLLFL